MTRRFSTHIVAVALFTTVFAVGCGERDFSTLQPAPPNTDPIVFFDSFQGGLDYQAFLQSRLDALQIDLVDTYEGEASLKFSVPGVGHPTEFFAGGAFVAPARDFSGYNALTFYAKSTLSNSTLDVAGFGNDNTGNSMFTAQTDALPIGTSWQKYIIPIPLPDRLTNESGLFFLADGGKSDDDHCIWFDNVQFETVDVISNPRPTMLPITQESFIGGQVSIGDTFTIFDVDGVDQTVGHMPGYFDYFSDDETVAIANNGVIEVVGGGTANITAKLGDVDVQGTVTVSATAPPSDPAPTPTLPAADVKSVFSNAYANTNVDTFSAPWDNANVSDLQINGDDVKVYTQLVFAGIDFTNGQIDASDMTHFHMDVFAPPVEDGDTEIFRIAIVDFGPNGVFDGNAPGSDDSEQQLAFFQVDNGGPASNPPWAPGSWVSLDIPMTRFTDGGLNATSNIAQIIIETVLVPTVYIDNIYFHK
ncbi:MAG: hypothetical protein HKN12_03235 [Gemmatimonadetes bacterium]|nr:hypothetical protein [Gemmatimonadota bacterium]